MAMLTTSPVLFWQYTGTSVHPPAKSILDGTRTSILRPMTNLGQIGSSIVGLKWQLTVGVIFRNGGAPIELHYPKRQ